MALPNQQEPEVDEDVREPEDGGQEPAKPEKPQVKENEDGTVAVDLDPPRKARRGGRQADEVARWRGEAEAARREAASVRAELAERMRHIESRVTQQQSGEDPYRREQQSIREQQETLQAAVRSAQTAEEANRYRQQFYALNERSEQLAEERILAKAEERIRRATANTAGSGEEAILRSEFPEVVANPNAFRWGYAYYQQLAAEAAAEGKPVTIATSRAALQKAAERFGLRQPSVPRATEAQQARYGAVPAQAGAMRSGGEIRLDGKLKQMAKDRWPDLDEFEAYARLAKLLRDADKQPAEE